MEGDSNKIELKHYGLSELPITISQYGPYPWSYVNAAKALVEGLVQLVIEFRPDAVVIEETNKGRNRYSQKALEFFHNTLLQHLEKFGGGSLIPHVHYINTMDWRKSVGLALSKEQRQANTRLRSASKCAKMSGIKVDKKSLGIKGEVTPKHLAVAFVNENYGLNFIVKDNDIADAICMGTSYLKGVKLCNGK